MSQYAAIDIDEFERRLRGPAPRPVGDPLAELARLVSSTETKPEALDAVFARPEGARTQSPVQDGAASLADESLRGSFEDEMNDHMHVHHAPLGTTDEAHDWSVPLDGERVIPPQQARSKRPLYATAAVIAVGLLGVGGTFAMKGHRGSSGDVVEVKAAPGPVKIQAQNNPDKNSPTADSSVLDRGAVATPVTRVVDREERPVDLSQAAQAARSAATDQMAALAAGAASGTAATGGTIFAEPRKVKTVSVRPDGTIVSAATTATAPTSAASGADKAATPKAPARVATTPKPTADKADTATRTPAAKPPVATVKPSPTKPTKVARADDGDTAPAASHSGGGFAIQLAAPGNETEAKTMASRLGQKYADALGGAHLKVQKASDKDIYRVRAGGLSREDAVAACEKVKAAGGACFVAKN